MNPSDRHVVVTGAASGIGRSVALALATRAMSVTCADIDSDQLEQTAKMIRDVGAAGSPVVCDVTDPAQVRLLLARATEQFGPVHGLVANAGGAQGAGCSFLDMTFEVWRAMLTLNLDAAFHCGSVFARHMAQRRSGSIVFISSNTSEVAIPGLAHYAAAKGGLRQLMRSMAVELAPLGVRVNAVAPGATRTPGNSARLDQPDMRAALTDRIPLGRLAEPDEVAPAVLYLLGDDASYTTGATIPVDGAYTCI